SPDTDSIKLKIDQDIAALATDISLGGATELAKNAVVTTTRKIKTSVVLNSADTAVLGGLLSDQDSDIETKVPVLGDIPIIGWLFKSSSKNKRKANLVVFITPRIIRNPTDGQNILDEKLKER